jgi:hypothetical protein
MKKEFIKSSKDLIPGQWYGCNYWTDETIIKYDKVDEDLSKIYFTEVLEHERPSSQRLYKLYNDWYYFGEITSFFEVDITQYKKYLPENYQFNNQVICEIY